MNEIRKSPFEFLLGTKNQIANVNNMFQGTAPRVLFLCSAGLLRSPTAAKIFSSDPYNWNTRAAGVSVEYALIPVSLPLLFWADKIVLMEQEHYDTLYRLFHVRIDKLVKEKGEDYLNVLDIPDNFEYNAGELVKYLVDGVESLKLF
jgi:predicted protein tyrosine phosphatase